MEKTEFQTKTNPNMTKRLALSGLIIALYVTVMFFTQSFAFGQYQIRIATSIYALSALYPFLVIPLSVANLLSNLLMGGLGLLDMFGGAAVGLVTAYLVHTIKKRGLNDWFIALPIILGPGLMVPLWLSYLINVPYKVLAASILIGQILPGITGVLLIKQLRKIDL